MNIDMKAAKIEFYEKIKPYFDAGLVREIYNSDHLCILSVGERVYVACPFVFLEDEPYGIYMKPDLIRKIIKKNRFFYAIINEVFSDVELNKDLIFDFSGDNLFFWRKWIEENKNLCKMDIELEMEIRNNLIS